MIRSSLRQYLAAQSEITALVSTRIYPVFAPESATFPAIIYARKSGGHDHNLHSATGSAMPAFELTCLAPTYEQVDQLAEVIRQKMQGFRGPMGSVNVRSVILDDEADGFEDLGEAASDRLVYSITLTYRIRYDETVPAHS